MKESIKEKLDGLIALQKIDSSLDEIKKRRGELPQEAKDLEDNIAGLETRLNNQREDLEASNSAIGENAQLTKAAQDKCLKYEEQQKEVRNNREYDAISKEIEYQELEVLSLERKTKVTQSRLEQIQVELEKTTEQLSGYKEILLEKQGELESLAKESQLEDQKLGEERERAATQVEPRLYHSYNKIRNGARNGLAVVSIQRDACGGCFNMVPPQLVAEVKEYKKILICEHCGRVLAGVDSPTPTKTKAKAKRGRPAASKS